MTWEGVARHERTGGRLSVPGCRAGPKVCPLGAIPRRWALKALGRWPVGIASLVCPAGHGDEVGGRKLLEGMKKQGARASRCNFLTPQKLDCTPKIFGFVVFVVKKVFSAPLVRMRSPVQIWIAAPVKPVVPQGIAGFFYGFFPYVFPYWPKTSLM